LNKDIQDTVTIKHVIGLEELLRAAEAAHAAVAVGLALIGNHVGGNWAMGFICGHQKKRMFLCTKRVHPLVVHIDRQSWDKAPQSIARHRPGYYDAWWRKVFFRLHHLQAFKAQGADVGAGVRFAAWSQRYNANLVGVLFGNAQHVHEHLALHQQRLRIFSFTQ
jgi:hypothetical protein